MHISTSVLTWLAAILTLGIFSFLWKDNPFYKLCEHLFVGVSAGYTIAITWHSTVRPDLIQPLFGQGQLLYIIPFVLGLLYFTRFIPRVSWLIRFPMAFVLGWAAGAAIPALFQTNIMRQMQGTLLVPSVLARWDTFLFALISLVGVVCTVLYFFFSREHKGALRIASETGIVYLMVGFGASFGYTVMARMSLLIGRLQFLLRDWLGIIK